MIKYALTTLLSITSLANAAVTITFNETGGDVVGKATGSFLIRASGQYTLTQQWGSSSQLAVASGFHYTSFGGSSSGTSLSKAPDAATVSFGFIGGDFIWTSDHGGNSGILTVNPNGYEFIWTGETLAGIGLGSLSETPVLAYTSNQGGANTISYALVPEPSAVTLGALGGLFLIARRKRKGLN